MVTITNGILTAQISETGAQLSRLATASTEYLWDGNPDIWPKHAPVLFPFVGRLPNQEYQFQGKTYGPMPIHGFVPTSRFMLESFEESAKLDGANRWQQTWHVTLPGIAPTVIIMLIMQIGSLLSSSTDKIILLYRTQTYEVADTIGTFVYRRGIQGGEYGYSTAVGLFNSFVNLMLLFTANSLSRKYSETSLF